MSAWTCHQSEGKAAQKIAPPRLQTPCWKGPGADSEEKREPASDINIGAVDSLKVLDPKRPIREADIVGSFDELRINVVAVPRVLEWEWSERRNEGVGESRPQ